MLARSSVLVPVVCAALALPASSHGEFQCAGVSEPAQASEGASLASLSAKPVASDPPRTIHALVVFAGFADEAGDASIPEWSRYLFDPDRPGSLSHFYSLMSFGQLELAGTALPRRYFAPRSASAYLASKAGRHGGYGRFVADILDDVDRDVDFGTFDNDGPDGVPNSGDDDGVVDYVFVICRSVPHGFILNAADGIAGFGFQDGARRGIYGTRDSTGTSGRRSAWGPHIVVTGFDTGGSLGLEGTYSQTVGVMAHEFGHGLGLPDLYDLEFAGPEDDSAGIGRWGLMGRGAHGWNGHDGPVGFCAWSLEQLGWIGPANTRLLEPWQDVSSLAMGDLFSGGRVVRMPLAGTRPGYHRQHPETGYLLIEARSRDAHYYNRSMPAEGVLVWWVRDRARNNVDEREKLVDLVCADGLFGDAGYPLGQVPQATGGRDNLDFWAHDAAYREAHAGNLGDATDPFDGDRFTTLEMASNPSLRSLIDLATEGRSLPSLRFGRQGSVLRLSAQVPSWSGSIRGEAHWAGTVLVDGDVTVEPGAELVIHRGTVVRMAPSDRLKAGRDPDLCEITVRGALVVPLSSWGGQTAIESAVPQGSWYGVVVDADAGAQLEVPEGGLALRDSQEGFTVPGKPPGVQGMDIAGLTILDHAEGGNAGNGDGRLQPGESFQVVVNLGNWTLTQYQRARVRLEVRAPEITGTWSSSRILYTEAPIGSMRRHEIAMPGLTLSPSATADSLDFRVSVSAGAASAQRLVRLPVARGLHLDPVQVERLDQVGEMIPVGSADDEIPLLVRVAAGDVASVVMVVRSAGREDFRSLPMERSWTEAGAFRMDFVPEGLGDYELVPRVTMRDGAAYLGTDRVTVAARVTRWEPNLVVWGPGATGATAGVMRSLFGPLGRATYLDLRGTNLVLSRQALSHYTEAGRAVYWVAGSPRAADEEALAWYLQQGGSLLLTIEANGWRPEGDLAEAMPFGDVASGGSGDLRLASADDDRVVPVRDYSILLGMASEAHPLLLDNQNRAAGAMAETGRSRLVILPAAMTSLTYPSRRALLEPASSFLKGRTEDAHTPEPVAEPFAFPVEPSIGFREIDVPEVVRVGSAQRPVTVLENRGGLTVRDVTVRYTVTRGSVQAAMAEEVVPRLVPGGETRVVLPAWKAGMPADYAVRMEAVVGGVVWAEEQRKVQAAEVRGRFVPVNAATDTLGNGVAFFDFDQDSDLDVYVVRLGAANSMYRNDGGRFTEVGPPSGLDDAGEGRGIALGDYDGDGDLDVYLANEGANRLLANRGNARFIDVSSALSEDGECLTDPSSGRSSGFFDFDLDGDLDLYVVNASGYNRLFENRGGLFVDVARSLRVADRGNGRGLAIGDYDGDGDPDIFVANQYSRHASELYRNEAGGSGATFVAAARELGLEETGSDVAGVFGDYDGDGDLDLFVSSEAAANVLWRNDGGHFTRGPADGAVGQRSVGAAFLDCDNDGDLDLVTTGLDVEDGGDQVFQNRGLTGFAPVGRLLGLRQSSQGRALAFGDYDGDGRWEFAVADHGRTQLYRNFMRGKSWLDVSLRGTQSNTHALGARIEVATLGHWQVRDLQSSYGYGSQVQPMTHFGVGDADRVDSVRVTWPDGVQTMSGGVAINQQLVLSHPSLGGLPGAKSVAVGTGPEPPDLSAYPNPSNSAVVLRYSVPTSSRVSLEIYNTAGQCVRTLVDGEHPPGSRTAVWHGRSQTGVPVGSGVYLCRLRAGRRALVRRVALVR